MTNTKSTKRALLVSVMAMVICFTMLLGTTFAWFTDTETSNGNVITAGKLEVKFEYSENGENSYSSAENVQMFKYTNWEPGYADIKQIKVTNDGSLAFNFKLKMTGDAASAIAPVIEVYCFAAGSVTRAELEPTNAAYLGTLDEVLATSFEFAKDNSLDANGDSKVFTIVLKMAEEAGNTYQNISSGDFSVQVLATQKTYEEDSIDDQYDKDAE